MATEYNVAVLDISIMIHKNNFNRIQHFKREIQNTTKFDSAWQSIIINYTRGSILDFANKKIKMIFLN